MAGDPILDSNQLHMKQTTLCYLEQNGCFLMLHRVKKKNDASHDKWIGVGGKCEGDESPDECMLREVYEETGLYVLEWQYRGIVTFISDIWPCEYMHLFTASKWTGRDPAKQTAFTFDNLDLQSKTDSLNDSRTNNVPPQEPFVCDEGDLQWVDKEELFSLNLWPGDRIFLRLLMDAQQPFFSLKLVYKGDELMAAKLDGKQLSLDMI